MTPRPRRSVLYLPGSNDRAIAKARRVPADALILDLEDAVSPDAKDGARRLVMDALRAGGFGRRECVVRVNTLDTPWGRADLAAVATAAVDAVLLPKVERPEQVGAARDVLVAAGAAPDLPLWIMAETPRGVLNLDAVLGGGGRIGSVVVGTSDLVKAMRARHTPTRESVLAALTFCVLAARAHGVDIIDGVYLDLDDDAGFRRSCQQGRELGFDGKTVIHPKQIDPANEIFGVSAAELAHAQAVVAAWEAARRDGKGVTVVAGKLVEQLHVDEAQRTIDLHRAIHEE